MLRRFVLVRSEDVSGVSGTGIVAEGIEFSNGKVAVSWLGELTSIEIHDSIENCIKIHGHGGRTTVSYKDFLPFGGC